jgi:hypothetical protein
VRGVQVFFEADGGIDIPTFLDALRQASGLMINPYSQTLLKLGLHSGTARYHHNWRTLRNFTEGALSATAPNSGYPSTICWLPSPSNSPDLACLLG